MGENFRRTSRGAGPGPAQTARKARRKPPSKPLIETPGFTMDEATLE